MFPKLEQGIGSRIEQDIHPHPYHDPGHQLFPDFFDTPGNPWLIRDTPIISGTIYLSQD